MYWFTQKIFYVRSSIIYLIASNIKTIRITKKKNISLMLTPFSVIIWFYALLIIIISIVTKKITQNIFFHFCELIGGVDVVDEVGTSGVATFGISVT